MATADKIMKAGVPAVTARAIVGDVELAVTATGSSSQANSYAIRAVHTQGTAGAGNTGYRLPAANRGDTFTIANWSTGNTHIIYPPVGGVLNGGSANAGLNLATAKSALCVCLGNLDYSVIVGA